MSRGEIKEPADTVSIRMYGKKENNRLSMSSLEKGVKGLKKKKTS